MLRGIRKDGLTARIANPIGVTSDSPAASALKRKPATPDPGSSNAEIAPKILKFRPGIAMLLDSVAASSLGVLLVLAAKQLVSNEREKT